MITFHSCSVWFSIESLPGEDPKMPAILAAPSSRPHRSIVCFSQARTSFMSRTSHLYAIMSSVPTADGTASRATGFVSAMLTFAPRRWRVCASARPIPDAPPVIAITFPSKLDILMIVKQMEITGRAGDTDRIERYCTTLFNTTLQGLFFLPYPGNESHTAPSARIYCRAPLLSISVASSGKIL
jgi:hypothetical protein